MKIYSIINLFLKWYSIINLVGNYSLLLGNSYSYIYISTSRAYMAGEGYVDVLYDHTKPSRVVSIASMQVYI